MRQRSMGEWLPANAQLKVCTAGGDLEVVGCTIVKQLGQLLVDPRSPPSFGSSATAVLQTPEC